MSIFFKSVTVALVSACALAVLITMLRSDKAFRAFLLTCLQGVAALFAVNITGLLTGVTLSVNWCSLGAGAIFGTPGVISLLILDVIFSS